MSEHDMITVAVVSQKGGAGKTTLTIQLAVAAELDGKPTAVIDLDPQASAKSWSDGRNQEAPAVISAQATRLDKDILKTAREAGVKLCLIDTAPHSERDALMAARAADFVLIPCRPAIFDIRAIGNTIDMVNLAKVPACVVLNAVKPRKGFADSRTDDAAQAISSYDIEIAPVRIVERVAFEDSITAGQGVLEYDPKGKAAAELQSLYKWLWEKVAAA